jgi:hypothetical protein
MKHHHFENSADRSRFEAAGRIAAPGVTRS